MHLRLRLFQRGSVFCCEDTETHKPASLGTRERDEALRLIEVRRQSFGNPDFARLMFKTCAGALDPLLPLRVWQDERGDFSASAPRPATDSASSDDVGIPFTGLSLFAKDGRLLTGSAWSCTWQFSFFETRDPSLNAAHAAFQKEQLERLRQ